MAGNPLLSAPSEQGRDHSVNLYQYQDFLNRSKDLYALTKYDILLRHLAGRDKLYILNAGCGSGELSLHLAAAGHRVLGIDPSVEYIRLAQDNMEQAAVDNCFFQVSSIEHFEDDSVFDCVVATDVLEHIDDHAAAFAKLASLVKPDGLLLITVPAGRWLFGYHDETLGHYRRYSRSELRRLVAPYCWIESIRYFGFSLVPICYLYSKLLRRPYPIDQCGDTNQNPFVSRILRTMLRIDRLLPMPFGTSLILKARAVRSSIDSMPLARKSISPSATTKPRKRSSLPHPLPIGHKPS